MHKPFKFRFVGIAVFLAAIAVFSAVAMFLWNAIMPEIFGLHALSYWQTVGLLLLARILFGGLGMRHFWPHGRHGKHGKHGMCGGFHHGNHPLREKWMSMTDDERTEFVRNHRGFRNHPFFGENPSRKDAPGSEGGKG
jgi:hypothetical protein